MATEEKEADDEPSVGHVEEEREVNQLLSIIAPILTVIALSLILAGALINWDTLLADGIIVLIATPIMIVIVSTLKFVHQNDYRFVIVCFIVLLAMLISAITGLH